MRYQSVAEFVKAIRRRRYLNVLLLIFACLSLIGLACSFSKTSSPVNLLGEALGCPQYMWTTSEDPWRSCYGRMYDGGAAVEASGGGGGIVETYMKIKVKGYAKKMRVKFQRAYYNGRFSIEIDGKCGYFDESVAVDGEDWKLVEINIPSGEHEVMFKYRHAGVGFRNAYNGVRIDTVEFLDQ